MTKFNKILGDETSTIESSVDEAASTEQKARADRLRTAVQAAGGNRVVSRAAGIPLGTLDGHIAGRDMKVGTLIALAAACNVPLEWLATGKETSPAVPPRAEPGKPVNPPLFQSVNMDMLGAAVDAAAAAFAAQNRIPQGRPFAQIICILYDEAKARMDRSE